MGSPMVGLNIKDYCFAKNSQKWYYCFMLQISNSKVNNRVKTSVALTMGPVVLHKATGTM